MRTELTVHLVRTALTVAAFVAATACAPTLAPVAAGATWLAAFLWAHDLYHGRLGLSRRGRDLALAIAGQIMLQSGHAVRVLHLRHHARPGAPDDLEGRAVAIPLRRTLVSLPALLVVTRVEAYRAGDARSRCWQLFEGALNVAAGAALLATPGGRGYVLVALALQATAPIWAGLLPHRAPSWLVRGARALAFTRSAILAALAFHELHHDAPHVPSARLRLMA